MIPREGVPVATCRLNGRRRIGMTAEEQIIKMTIAIKQPMKVMGDRFGSTETDVARAVDALKASILAEDGKIVPPS
jgi:hypothetical protein